MGRRIIIEEVNNERKSIPFKRLVNNKFFEWLLYMVGYAIVLIAVLIIFSKSFYISNQYYGVYAFIASIIIYILIFQLFLYPIVNLQHFLVTFVPVVVYIFMYEKTNFITKFAIPLVILFYFCLYTVSYYVGLNLNLDNNFLYLRNTKISEYLSSEVGVILEYSKDFDYEFFIVDNAYMRKLFLDIPIGRYDFLLNGNMGYQGGEGGRKFVNEMDSICSKSSCVFFVDEGIKNSRYGQFNKEIYDYVVNNYKKCIEHENLSVFTN